MTNEAMTNSDKDSDEQRRAREKAEETVRRRGLAEPPQRPASDETVRKAVLAAMAAYPELGGCCIELSRFGSGKVAIYNGQDIVGCNRVHRDTYSHLEWDATRLVLEARDAIRRAKANRCTECARLGPPNLAHSTCSECGAKGSLPPDEPAPIRFGQLRDADASDFISSVLVDTPPVETINVVFFRKGEALDPKVISKEDALARAGLFRQHDQAYERIGEWVQASSGALRWVALARAELDDSERTPLRDGWEWEQGLTCCAAKSSDISETWCLVNPDLPADIRNSGAVPYDVSEAVETEAARLGIRRPPGYEFENSPSEYGAQGVEVTGPGCPSARVRWSGYTPPSWLTKPKHAPALAWARYLLKEASGGQG